jgi:uncharacterized membrane-anchored protein YjiN (DUF445 family)
MSLVDRHAPMAKTNDDADRARRLRAMKTLATSLLVLAAIIFVVAKINEDDAAWIGYVRAIAEAAMVGALADWFAVTALFRHPLGLPIPHTAIIPKRKDQIGASLGDFVESNFLTAEIIDERLRSAEAGRRLGEWLATPVNADRSGRALADASRGVLEVLDDDEIQSGLEQAARQRIESVEVSPLAGRILEVTMDGGHHRRLLDAALVGADRFLRENHGTFRRRLYEESPWWVPEGVDNRVLDKIYEVVGRFLRDVHAHPDHEVRLNIETQLRQFALRLQTDPELQRKGEQLKHELLDHPEVRRWFDSLWTETKSSLLSALDDDDGALRQRLSAGIHRLGVRLIEEPDLQRKVDDWAASALAHVVSNYRSEVAQIIESTVAKWDAEATSNKIELQVGRDLQFIRINGTVVGGLAGLVIHAVGELL